jgi:hypothetical protein
VVDDPLLLYTMMHSYLRDAGVDGVKVDCQAGVGLIGAGAAGWRARGAADLPGLLSVRCTPCAPASQPARPAKPAVRPAPLLTLLRAAPAPCPSRAGSAVGGGPALSRSFHAGLEESVAEHFPGNHCINCMCHSTENVYRCGRRHCCR